MRRHRHSDTTDKYGKVAPTPSNPASSRDALPGTFLAAVLSQDQFSSCLFERLPCCYRYITTTAATSAIIIARDNISDDALLGVRLAGCVRPG